MNNIEIHIIMIDGPRIDCWTSILHSFSFLLYCFFRIGDGIASSASTLTSACLRKFLSEADVDILSHEHEHFSFHFSSSFFRN